MKKILLALGLAAAVTLTASAESLWQYSPTMTIDMSTAKLSVQNGQQILEFEGTEKITDGTCIYSYVYDLTSKTIQIKEMEKITPKLHYTSTFSPEPVNSPNPVIHERVEMAQAVYEKVLSKK